MRIFITGTAGFIGYHLAARLLRDGHEVVGLDGLTDYYDPALKRARLGLLAGDRRFVRIDGLLEDKDLLHDTMTRTQPEIVVHLAAQAGVRYSITNPGSYVTSNLVGTYNLLEAARAQPPRHLLLASSSSVYGGNAATPFAETDRTDFPLSLYAATKRSGEAMSHSYAHLFGIPTTAVRFFTVYGPWGRPDMALFRFAEAMLAGRPIEVYGDGSATRDFTYIDDLTEALMRLTGAVPTPAMPVGLAGLDSLSPIAPWRVVNVGSGQPLALNLFIEALERAFGVRALRTVLPTQPGDVHDTCANPALLRALTGFAPATPVDEGVRRFAVWFRSRYAP